MSFCVDLVSEDSFYENITLGVTKLLESDPRICNVNVERRSPCDRVALSNWEQRHSAVLPEDLRSFYASSDGFLLTWNYKYSADDILPVGSIRVNSLNELFFSPALKDLLDFSMTRHNSGPRPILNTKSKIFELDSCRTIGKVCLIYTGGSWSVWLATREGAWGWLADSFTHYFRMALVHMGLPGWQAAFANLPLIPWAEQLFLLLAPHLLEKTGTDSSVLTTSNETGLNHIDPNIFKTSDRITSLGAISTGKFKSERFVLDITFKRRLRLKPTQLGRDDIQAVQMNEGHILRGHSVHNSESGYEKVIARVAIHT